MIYDDTKCSIFLADSGILNSGFGMYTTRTIDKGSYVLPFADSPSFVVTDSEAHFNNKNIHWNHYDYYWNGRGLGEFEAHETKENIVSFGALANYHTYLENVEGDFEEYDDTILDRFADPGAGAITYHRGHKFRVTKTILAGEEIFANVSCVCYYILNI